MEHITVTEIKGGTMCRLTPDEGYLLQRGMDAHLYPEAEVSNKPSELRRWKAVKV